MVRRSLMRAYPWHIEVPLLLLATTGMLIAGLSLPVLTVRKLIFWEEGWSVLTGIHQLYHEGDTGIAAIILLFSVVFPLLKLAMLALVWFVPQRIEQRERTLAWLAVLGKWSMLDVFVVSLIVLVSKTSSLLDAQPRAGVYVFGGAVLMSMMLTFYIQRLAQREADSRSEAITTA